MGVERRTCIRLLSVNLLTTELMRCIILSLEHSRDGPGYQEDASAQSHQVLEECHRTEGNHPLQEIHGRCGQTRPSQGFRHLSGSLASQVRRVLVALVEERRVQRRVQ